MPEQNTFTTTDATATETATSVENLTPDEQDSLAVGEQLEAEQGELLAGKYKNAEELEKAYNELQQKLGDRDSEEGEEGDTEEKPEPTSSPAVSLINDASAEYWNNGESLTPETIEKFSSMSSKDLVDAYIEITKNNPQAATAQQVDISDAEVNQIQNSVGGEGKYNDLVNWASNNLQQNEIDTFDSIVNSGNSTAIQLAVAGLKSRYETANGYEGRMLTGNSAPSTDTFRSQQELVAAMGDPRYDNDPAYRQDVIEKLDRSDLEF